MRRLLLLGLGTFAVAAASSASAADLPPPIPTKAPPAPVAYYNWTGFYIGANGGGGWGHDSFSGTQTTLLGPTAFSGTSNSSGPLAGGQIGFNYEFPTTHIVIGIEADGDWANIVGAPSSCSTFTTGVLTGVTAGCAANHVTLQDFGTVRGRLGYAWNNVLLYGTGGWAWANTSGNSGVTCLGPTCPATPSPIPFTGGTATFSNSLTSGWTAGGGLEWGFLPHWTARIEYLHLQFNDVGTSYTSTPLILGVLPSPATTHVSTNSGVEVVRVGVNYLFNFGP
jgi:outer membrane immunogenic protein